MKTLMMIAMLTMSPLTFAHEGHDHDAPAMVQAPRGGVIKSLEKTHVEVVSKGKNVSIYLYDKDLKPVDGSTYKVSAVAEIPRKKSKETLALTQRANAFETSFDAKGAHRYTLTVTVFDPQVGHDDKLSFTIEPRK